MYDCYALYQASAPHLRQPGELELVRRECERHLQLVSAARQRDAAANGLQKWLGHVVLKGVRFREAEASSVLEHLRQRIGEALGTAPPNFIVDLPDELKNRKLTLDLGNIPAIYALQQVASLARAEMCFERHGIVFVPAALSADTGVGRRLAAERVEIVPLTAFGKPRTAVSQPTAPARPTIRAPMSGRPGAEPYVAAANPINPKSELLNPK